MTFTLYNATIPNYVQTLTALSGVLEKAAAHGQTNNLPLATLVETKLAPDMLPLRFQLLSAVHHSRGAIEGVQNGVFEPPARRPETTYTDLQALVTDARAWLEKLTPATINGLVGRDLVFKLGDRQMPFVAEDFLMSFSMPNFYFHSTTAYDLMRMVGVPLGKRDYLGRLRMKG